jgi:hypothetical protein
LQAVPGRVTGPKTGGVAGAQHFFAAVRDEHDLTGKDVDELVAAGVPMPLARPGARRQLQKIYAKLRQSGRVTQFSPIYA